MMGKQGLRQDWFDNVEKFSLGYFKLAVHILIEIFHHCSLDYSATFYVNVAHLGILARSVMSVKFHIQTRPISDL